MIKQITTVTWMNLRSLPQRIGTAWVIVIGIAVTVAVMVSVLAMAEGFKQTLKGSARTDRVIVLRGGSDAELQSTIKRDNTLTIMDRPEVRRDAAGRPVASAEAVVIVVLPQKTDGTDANVTLRGIGSNAMTLRPEMHLVAGRMFQPGVRELVVGKSAVLQFKGLEIGGHVAFHDSNWTVVGIFEDGGDAHESEMLGDSETVLSAFRRNHFQSVTVMLNSPQAFDRFKDALTTDPTLKVKIEREPDYYAAQSRSLSMLLNLLADFIGGIMALGACFGALNSMYTAVSTRTREIATLRAIGFSGLPIVISVLVESLLLALIGSAIGSLGAWLMFNGNTVNTLGAGFSQVVFHLTVTASLLTSGVFVALAVGMIGGLLPAIRAARQPIATALRAS